MRARFIPLVAAAALLAAVPAAADITVQAQLDANRIGVDESTMLTIEVRSSGIGSISAQPHFNLENLEIASGPQRSESFRWVNGAASRTLLLVWQLAPKGIGPARVRGVNVEIGGQIYQLPDQEVAVQQEPVGAGPAPRAASPHAGFPDPFEDFFGRPRRAPQYTRPKLFLRAVASPERAYIGQQITYTVYLYTQGDVTSVNPRALPAFRGFWVRELELPQRSRADMVEEQGERYGRVALMQRALFPLTAGAATIEPFAIDIGLRVADGSAFGPMLSSIEELHRTTNAVNLDIVPLPPAPTGFRGAVGRLALEAKLDRDQVLQGDAATLILSLSGDGNLQGLQDPALTLPPGLKQFPPQKDSAEHTNGTNIGGRRTWSYVLVPEKAGDFTIGAIEVPYFDPSSASYKVAAAPPLSLRATPLIAAAPAPAASPTAAPAGPERATGAARWGQFMPWIGAAASGGLIALLGVWLARRAGSSQRSAARSTDARLRQAAHEERPRQAAALIEEAWRDFLAARFELAPGTPSPQWPEELARRGVDPQSAENLKRLADDLHYLRYAPQLAAADSLRGDVVDRSRRLLRALR